MADDPATELAQRIAEEEKKVYEKSIAEYWQRMKGKPTPTQAENDKAALGEMVLEKEADGSDPDPVNQPFTVEGKPVQEGQEDAEKHLEAAKPQHYKTRHVKPNHSEE
jgi:hypothetical protein